MPEKAVKLFLKRFYAKTKGREPPILLPAYGTNRVVLDNAHLQEFRDPKFGEFGRELKGHIEARVMRMAEQAILEHGGPIKATPRWGPASKRNRLSPLTITFSRKPV